jgi:hypothetical protein
MTAVTAPPFVQHNLGLWGLTSLPVVFGTSDARRDLVLAT